MRPQALIALASIPFMLALSAVAHATTEPDLFTRALAKGPLYAAGAAILGGLAVSLTPCVYPMVAVTVSAFGAREARSRWEGTKLSAVFVLGIACMFTPLGVIAGLTGSVFGAVLQNPWVVLGIAALFLAMAASMFGAFEMTLPSALTNKLATMGGIGYKGAFGLGFICGVIAAPCTGPILTGILAWIAKTQSATLGGAAMAAFSLGLGFPFFMVGAFAVQLPKSGPWMVHVKSALGIVLIVVALYFINLHFPVISSVAHPTAGFFAAAALAVVVGLLIGGVHRDFAEPDGRGRVLKALGVLLMSGGAFLSIAALLRPTETLSWEPTDYVVARQKARVEARPLLVDFTAAWCVSCKELDKLTFSHDAVEREAGRFVAVRVDATDDEDPKVERALAEFSVKGLPTVILFDSEGREARRFNDFVEAEPFLEALRKVN
ncbi:MAG TPA: cytochrome c biogenesis protein CcdA [Polyangiaceae bacterium]|nr:cytochrome c biogenesis protein CcdA [Polyangiaceae bacterium]